MGKRINQTPDTRVKAPPSANTWTIPSSLLIECMQDEVWYTDTSGHFILANPCACEAFALENVNNLDIQEFAASLEVLRPDGSPRPIDEAPPLRALRGETVIEQEEIVRLPKSGQFRYRLVTSSPVKDATGTIIGCVSVVHDITDKKQHERERDKEAARLKSLVSILQHQSESIQDFLNYTLDQAIRRSDSKIGYIYHYNEETQHFSLNTWSREVMPACNVINAVTEYDLAHTGFWGEVVRQRKPIINNNFQATNAYKKGTSEGHVRLEKFMSIPVFSTGKIVGVIGLANKEEDYTETDVLQTSLLMEAVWKVVDRMKAEQALKTANEELEKKILQRTSDLISANKELESFSYSVSHDLKAPLRAIEGFSEIFMNEFGASVPPEGLRLLERIRKNAIHMNDLIESLLSLAKITQWNIDLKMVDLSAIASEIRDEMSSTWGNRDIQFEIEPAMKTWGDDRLLRIIFQNLISNAVKFTLRNKNPHISIGSVLNSEGQTEYFVRDNGVGFDMNYKDKLFVAFQRLHSDKDFPGNGIGLANVSRAVQRLGGTIRAEGEPNRGATFYFTIPPQAPVFA